MSWIKEYSPEEKPRLKSIYERTEARTKEKVANVLKVHSIDPDALERHIALYEHLMFADGPLSRREREMIGVVVSSANECPYCVKHHGDSFAHVTDRAELAEVLSVDYDNADISKRERAICDYAMKLSETPYKITEEDIERLRKEGLDDLAIFHVNQIAAYFNYVNRVVHGLGVNLESQG